MVSGMELIPDRREILRYLGYKGAAPDEDILREIDVCVDDLNKAVTPRFVYEKFALSREPAQPPENKTSEDGTAGMGTSGEDAAEEQLCFAGIRVCSRALSINLRECCGVYLMAVTLGPGPDMLVRRASVSRMSRAVIYQAAAAAMTEVWCDQINERIRREAEREGLYTRPRFSPGYGDLPLSLQKDISRILNMPKEIGVSLTDTMLMTPSKSVTALIGVSRVPAGHRNGFLKTGCADCPASAECAYAMPDPERLSYPEAMPDPERMPDSKGIPDPESVDKNEKELA